MYNITKIFKFNGMHIVRNCSSSRCKYSIHAHTYKVEMELSSSYLDNGQMVVDFGLLKGTIKSLIHIFNNAVTIWSKDDPEYIESIKRYNPRWVEIPFSPSAEQYSRILYVLLWNIIQATEFMNGEVGISLNSVTVWETRTGKSTFRPDDNPSFEDIQIKEWKLSKQVRDDLEFDWQMLVDYIELDEISSLKKKIFKNPEVELQVIQKQKEEGN